VLVVEKKAGMRRKRHALPSSEISLVW